jgi:hypothetical protein
MGKEDIVAASTQFGKFLVDKCCMVLGQLESNFPPNIELRITKIVSFSRFLSLNILKLKSLRTTLAIVGTFGVYDFGRCIVWTDQTG